jgi:hypothetical protein
MQKTKEVCKIVFKAEKERESVPKAENVFKSMLKTEKGCKNVLKF